jgi:UDP-N-acetylglucosamine--N-acetylmuramyl-(pentapeptide) pyrophosphoryl-undecaprenol N-acetylglucosamine transferase
MSRGIDRFLTSRRASKAPGADEVTVRLIVAGGGTGGHTYPALAAVRSVRAAVTAQGGSVQVLWVGAAASLESRVAAGEGIAFAPVATGKIRRASNPLRMISWANVTDMCRVPLGVLQACRVVAGFRPDVVLATGGYVAVPVGLAAWLRRRPLVIHEQTVRLGLANKVLARMAARVALSSESSLDLLPAAVRRDARVTGNPVRPELLTGDGDKAIEALGLGGFDRSLPTVWVTGGAQGARQINTLVREILPWLLERANVVHQCGAGNLEEFIALAATLPGQDASRYLPVGFVGAELPDVLALADVVIARSGAGTLAEVTALGKAAILIPLPGSAGNEQEHNARHLGDGGAAIALIGPVSPQQLRDAAQSLIADPVRRAEVAGRARELGRVDAAEQLGALVLAVATGNA